ncbi:MAG: hypothetical protein B6D44_06660 [Ignavibacteriales bacterium UTCHB2]|nr:MAG: hypothetical protein BWY38_02630 [Ignavibacteria bacterium ADurb.Bin266]OQY73637.1 MAG: hypothetical protein B6D44_06660 [Ignavibacteriales bacterium UTCHB2]
MKLKYFFSLLLSFLIFNCSLLIGTVRYVSKTGSSTPPYTSWETASDSIQKCINLCVDGDTIYVANGVYKENLVINTAISLIGSSMDSTVIDGRGMGDITIKFNVNGKIENFNIYGKEKYAGGVACIYSIVETFLVIEVRNCKISETGVGIAGWGLISDYLILKDLRAGINIAGNPNSYNQISNSIIIVSDEQSYGISLPGPNYANYEIRNNIILFTGSYNPWEGIAIGAPRRVVIKNNLISGFMLNIFVDTITDSLIVINNILMNQMHYGIGGSIVSLNYPVYTFN